MKRRPRFTTRASDTSPVISDAPPLLPADARAVLDGLKGKRQERVFTFERTAVDAENRTVELSFSSTEPAERFYGIEILDHQPQSVRLQRLNDGGAVLFNHDSDKHIGAVESGTARVDTGSGKGRAMVRFGKGVLAAEKFQDVQDGILKNVSVGYWVHDIALESEKEGVKTFRVRDWEPLEISFAPVPMDPTVGVGRAAEEPKKEEPPAEVKVVKSEAPSQKTEVRMKCGKCGTELVDNICPKCVLDRAKEMAAAERAKEQKGNVETLAIGKQYGQDALAARFVSEGRSADELKDEILRGIHSGAVSFQKPAAEKPAASNRFASLGEQLIAVARAEQKGSMPDARLVSERTAISGASEGIPSDGGFLVQDDFTTALLSRITETGLLYSKCRRIPIGPGANGISAPVIDETTRANGYRLGGVQIYRDAEGQEATAKKPKFGKIEMKLKKLHGLFYATDEMLADYAQLGAIANQAFGEEFGFVLDDEIVRGDGAAQMLGILNAPCLVSVSGETGQTTDTIVAENLEKMYSRMPARSKSNATWYINDEVWPQMFQLYHSAGTAAVPVFVPPAGISGAPFGTLFGRPIQPIEQAAGIGDAGCVLFADLSQYLVIEKGVLEAASSVHVRFIYDEMCFKWTIRCNGQPIPRSALTPYMTTNTSTTSPFVTVAAI